MGGVIFDSSECLTVNTKTITLSTFYNVYSAEGGALIYFNAPSCDLTLSSSTLDYVYTTSTAATASGTDVI